MKKGIIASILEIILIIFIQTSVLHVFGLNYWAPNLFAAILIPAAFLYGPLYGVLVGCFGGLIIDLLTGYGLGMVAIPCTIAGFFIGMLKSYINGDHYSTSVTFSTILVVFLELFSLAIFYFSRKIISITVVKFFHTLLVIITTAGFSALFHTLLQKQYNLRLSKDEIQSKYIRY